MISFMESLNRGLAVSTGTSYNDSPWKSLAWSPTFPEIGVPTNNGHLILEAGDRWGDELSSAGAGDGLGQDVEDSPEPDV